VIAGLVEADGVYKDEGRLTGQKVIPYVGQDSAAPGYIDFSKAAEGFKGELKVTFVDTFGIKHEAHQPVRVGAREILETTDAIKWVCGTDCRVHVMTARRPDAVRAMGAPVLNRTEG
jgi:hypothetical protein